jgi:hypothetical protein
MNSKYLLKVVIALRGFGYLFQFFAGLYVAGLINLICCLPLIFFDDKEEISSNKFIAYLQKNAIKIHAYAGGILALQIAFSQILNFLNSRNFAYIEMSVFGFLLFISFAIFNLTDFEKKSSLQNFLIIHKYKLSAICLLLANSLQFHAGILLHLNTLSTASIFFFASMILLYFINNNKIKTNN